jgi:hypothetical protein
MAIFKAEISKESAGATLLNGHNAVRILAEDATDARSLLDAMTQGHPSAGAWANATITAVAEGDLSPVSNPHQGAELAYALTVTIAGGTVNSTFVVPAVAGEDFAALMAKAVIAFNADAGIANAAWSSPNLTVAAIADNIGDHTVTASFQFGDQEVESVIGTITDGGIAGADLTVAMTAGVRDPLIEFYQT